MSLRVKDEAPDLRAETTQATIEFRECCGRPWAILLSHPKAKQKCRPGWKAPNRYVRIVAQPS
ncbi:MAG: hypothetical protein ACJ74Z_10935 [Bryobacteraceae bacterium]